MATRRGGKRRAFTIIEVIVIVVILGVLAAVIAPRVMQHVGESKVEVAKTNANAIASALKTYVVHCGTPQAGASLMILMERPSGDEGAKWQGPYLDNVDQIKDPWGREFILLIPPEHNADFDVVSYGADGQPGGEGENKDIVNGKR